MCRDAESQLLVATGDWGQVRYAVRQNGTCPAKDFIDQLSDTDSTKLAAMFDLMAAVGQIKNREKFKKVEGPIFEFKSFQIRIGCFQHGRVWFLTHGFQKKANRWRRAELDRAETIRSEHLAREGAR
jgi:hypothetical protein